MTKMKTTLLGSALAVALSATPAIAADFHALAAKATPTPLSDEALDSIRGGARPPAPPGFSVANAAPVTAANRSGRPDLVNSHGDPVNTTLSTPMVDPVNTTLSTAPADPVNNNSVNTDGRR